MSPPSRPSSQEEEEDRRRRRDDDENAIDMNESKTASDLKGENGGETRDERQRDILRPATGTK